MAVTSEKPREHSRSQPAGENGEHPAEAPEAKARADEHETKARAAEPEQQSRADEPEGEANEDEARPDGEKPRSSGMKHILGGGLAFVALAVYFIWLGKEMGGATPDGGAELAGVFGAILISVVALAAGALLGRSRA